MMAQAIMSGWPRDVIAHRRQFILTTHIRIRRLQFLAQLVRMPPTALPRQMLLALHAHLKTRPTHTRPYDGSIFMDIPDPTSMGGIISLVNDEVGWHALCTPENPKPLPMACAHELHEAHGTVAPGRVGMTAVDRDAVGSTRCSSLDPTRRETPPVGCGSKRTVTHKMDMVV